MRSFLPLAALLVAAGFVGPEAEQPPVPRYANITAACNPSANPSVNPQRIDMTRADHIEWREPSGRANSWTIAPKDPQDWLFDQASFTGTQSGPAVTPRPRPGAQANHVYRYMVTIRCSDGSTQVIDPDIVIGEALD